MNDLLQIMLAPFVACLILTGIHTYLGLQVVRRGVIFVDLALAQIAGLGASFAFLLGLALHSTGSYFVSLAATMIAAVVLAQLRGPKRGIPPEAYIGILYAVSAAAVIIMLSFAPEGGEELKSLMVGHLLFVGWHELLVVTLVYSAIALLHWRFRDNFFAAAEGRAERAGLWDFLFYASLGFVVTSSVEMGGVLVVFSFLVVPAVCGMLLADTVKGQLLTGWLVGLVATVGGMLASYQFDLPTGATVVCVFGIILLLVFLKGQGKILIRH